MEIYDEIRKFVETHNTANVVIAGQSCSGKTTLANRIREHFNGKYSVSIISQDDYFKDLRDIPIAGGNYLMDVPEAFWIEEFLNDVHLLFNYGNVNMPNYDISTNSRVNKNKVILSSEINVFEGLHTIQIFNGLRNSISIFVDTDSDTCLKRRIERDSTKFGIPEKRIREYWNECIQPMSKRFIFPQKFYADIIFRR